jgi:hypothetical protein
MDASPNFNRPCGPPLTREAPVPFYTLGDVKGDIFFDRELDAGCVTRATFVTPPSMSPPFSSAWHAHCPNNFKKLRWPNANPRRISPLSSPITLDRGHQSMNKVRKWVALLVIIIPCAIIWLAMYTDLFTPTGSIYGRVTYNGTPLDRGFILFYPTDELSSDWIVGTIEKDGSYRIDSKWRHSNGKARFRICIIPRKGRPAAHVDLPGERSHSHVVPVELNSKESDSHPIAVVDAGFPKRFTNITTSGLQITLGREPARIDIDMKD